MGLKSELYGGRKRRWAPTPSMAARTSGCLCTARFIEHHDVAGAQRGDQDLFDIGRIVDRSVEDRRRA